MGGNDIIQIGNSFLSQNRINDGGSRRRASVDQHRLPVTPYQDGISLPDVQKTHLQIRVCCRGGGFYLNLFPDKEGRFRHYNLGWVLLAVVFLIFWVLSFQ